MAISVASSGHAQERSLRIHVTVKQLLAAPESPGITYRLVLLPPAITGAAATWCMLIGLLPQAESMGIHYHTV
jgi:hypothetical protein